MDWDRQLVLLEWQEHIVTLVNLVDYLVLLVLILQLEQVSVRIVCLVISVLQEL